MYATFTALENFFYLHIEKEKTQKVQFNRVGSRSGSCIWSDPDPVNPYPRYPSKLWNREICPLKCDQSSKYGLRLGHNTPRRFTWTRQACRHSSIERAYEICNDVMGREGMAVVYRPLFIISVYCSIELTKLFSKLYIKTEPMENPELLSVQEVVTHFI